MDKLTRAVYTILPATYRQIMADASRSLSHYSDEQLLATFKTLMRPEPDRQIMWGISEKEDSEGLCCLIMRSAATTIRTELEARMRRNQKDGGVPASQNQ